MDKYNTNLCRITCLTLSIHRHSIKLGKLHTQKQQKQPNHKMVIGQRIEFQIYNPSYALNFGHKSQLQNQNPQIKDIFYL